MCTRSYSCGRAETQTHPDVDPKPILLSALHWETIKIRVREQLKRQIRMGRTGDITRVESVRSQLRWRNALKRYLSHALNKILLLT